MPYSVLNDLAEAMKALDGKEKKKRCFQVSPKLLGFGEACFGVLKVSRCGVASWALRNLATSVSMIWICFQVMQLELHACTAKIHAGGSACSSLPVRLDHLFFTCRFCLQCFVPLPLLFFPSNASWLPPGRLTRSIACCRNDELTN